MVGFYFSGRINLNSTLKDVKISEAEQCVIGTGDKCNHSGSFALRSEQLIKTDPKCFLVIGGM